MPTALHPQEWNDSIPLIHSSLLPIVPASALLLVYMGHTQQSLSW